MANEVHPAVQRLADLLHLGDKTRGARYPIMKTDGSGRLDQYAREMVEAAAADIVTAARLVTTNPSQIVQDLLKGSAHPAASVLVTIHADDLFQLVEEAGGPKVADQAKMPSPAAAASPPTVTPAPVVQTPAPEEARRVSEGGPR